MNIRNRIDASVIFVLIKFPKKTPPKHFDRMKFITSLIRQNVEFDVCMLLTHLKEHKHLIPFYYFKFSVSLLLAIFFARSQKLVDIEK